MFLQTLSRTSAITLMALRTLMTHNYTLHKFEYIINFVTYKMNFIITEDLDINLRGNSDISYVSFIT